MQEIGDGVKPGEQVVLNALDSRPPSRRKKE